MGWGGRGDVLEGVFGGVGFLGVFAANADKRNNQQRRDKNGFHGRLLPWSINDRA
jgi:hypothetical protein